MNTKDRTEDAVLRLLASNRRAIESLLDVTESPVERLLLAELMALGWRRPTFAEWTTLWESLRVLHGVLRHVPERGAPRVLVADIVDYALVPQLPIERGGCAFRLDLALLALGPRPLGPHRLAIEVDGHDFHERTREQASRDRLRDRILATGGWTVLRYTGGDVYRRAGEIASELEALCQGDDVHADDGNNGEG